ASDSAAHWAVKLNQHNVPAGEVLDVPTVLDHAQLRERQFVRNLGNAPGLSQDVQVIRSGFRLRSGDPSPQTPPPALGADTYDILRELGHSEQSLHEYQQQGVI